jgi:tetratricopeptide (TPR) repeat protein
VDSAERVLGDDALDLLQELTDRMLLTRHADGRLATMLAVSEFALQELGSEHTAWLEGARRRMVQVFGEMADGLGALGSEPAPLSYALLGREMDGALRAFRLAVEAGWVDESARILLWTLPVLMRQRKTRRALQLISEFGGARIADPALEKAVNWRIVRAWFNAGMLDQALRASKRLQALHPCPEMDTLVLAQRIGIGPALATHAEDFQRASDRVADPSRTAAERLVLYASLVALYRDPPKRVAWSEARLQLARHEGSEWDVADAQNHYSNLLSFVGRPDDAEVHVRRMARTYERAAFGTPAVYYGMMASIRVQQGRLDEAEAFGVRCYEHASEGGAVIRMAWICGTLGKITGIRGDYEGAIAWFSRALACAEELGDHRHVALYQSNLGEAWRRQGREGEARRALQESAALFDRLGESAMVVTPLRSHGRLELDARRLERAEELLARAMSHESSGGGLRWLTQSVYAEVLARLGRDGALELAREATREALLLGRSESLANVLYHHACVAEVLGQTAESREQLDRAWELVEALGVDPDAEIRTRVQALRQDL